MRSDLPRYGALLFLLLAPLAAQAESAAVVTWLQGQVHLAPGGEDAKKRAVEVGATAQEGDAVFTGDASLVELTLPDKSVIRIAPRSRLSLEKTHFAPSGDRIFSAKLLLGSVWSKVTSVLGGASKFEVRTENAVAGVRGTTFRVDAKADRSSVVSVFAGSVAVGKGGPSLVPHVASGVRREKAPPGEVSKDAWEQLVLEQMKVVVSPLGRISAPTKLESKDLDDFSRLNQSRDRR